MNQKKKIRNTNASFPSSKIQKYDFQHNNKFERTLKSKINSQSQQKKHKSFIKRQNNTSISPHQRIQELLHKSKKKHKNKNKNKNKNKSKLQLDNARAQFRWMNEMLYNSTGTDAKNKIKHYENLFIEYHKTYNNIVQKEWAESPLQKIIKSITIKLKKLTKIKDSNTNNSARKQTFLVADFGCGDAKIAKYFDKNYNKQKNTNMKVNVKSFDLISLNKYVIACNMSHVPLSNESVDIVIFCLSLMGTNFHEYLIEANRVLKPNGLLKIVEVRSRFYGINKFEKFLNRTGFDVVAKDLDNTRFALFHCQKSVKSKCQRFPTDFDAKTVLKPCAYKKR